MVARKTTFAIPSKILQNCFNAIVREVFGIPIDSHANLRPLFPRIGYVEFLILNLYKSYVLQNCNGTGRSREK
jgi:hypothetical protein